MNKRRMIIISFSILLIIVSAGIGYYFGSPVRYEHKIENQINYMGDIFTKEYTDKELDKLSKISTEEKESIDVHASEFFFDNKEGWIQNVRCDKFSHCDDIKKELDMYVEKLHQVTNETFSWKHGSVKEDKKNGGFTVLVSAKGPSYQALWTDTMNMTNHILDEELKDWTEVTDENHDEFLYEVAKAKVRAIRFLMNEKLDSYITNDASENVYFEKQKDGTYKIDTISRFYSILAGGYDYNFQPDFTKVQSSEEIEEISKKNVEEQAKRAYDYYHEMLEWEKENNIDTYD